MSSKEDMMYCEFADKEVTCSLQFKVKRLTAVSLIQADEQAYTQLHLNPIHTNEHINL